MGGRESRRRTPHLRHQHHPHRIKRSSANRTRSLSTPAATSGRPDGHDQVLEFNSKHEYLRQFGKEGSGEGQFKGIGGIATNASGDVYVTDYGNNRVEEFSPTGTFLRQFGSQGLGAGQFYGPTAIALDSGGNVWVLNTHGVLVQEFSATGTYMSGFGSSGLAFGGRQRPCDLGREPVPLRTARRQGAGVLDHGHIARELRRTGLGQRPLPDPGGHRKRPDHRQPVRHRPRHRPRAGVQLGRGLHRQPSARKAPEPGSSLTRRPWQWAPPAPSSSPTARITASRNGCCPSADPAVPPEPAGSRQASESGRVHSRSASETIGRAAQNGLVTDYGQPLREQDVEPDPLRQFAVWFREAQTAGVRLPEAAAVATASADGAPSARMVLVKGFDDRGFVFYSNYDSRKGRELDANPRAALLFYWDPLGRQVRIEGPVEHVSAGESAAYVRSRPRASQLSALASPQSETIESRQALERRVAELQAQYGAGELPLPETGAAFGSPRRPSSSGSSATIACTIGCATAAAATRGGWSSGWRRSARELLGGVPDAASRLSRGSPASSGIVAARRRCSLEQATEEEADVRLRDRRCRLGGGGARRAAVGGPERDGRTARGRRRGHRRGDPHPGGVRRALQGTSRLGLLDRARAILGWTPRVPAARRRCSAAAAR